MGNVRLFDSHANGYVRGEGVAAIVLKPLRNALKEGDHIYGVIKGTAVNHGGHVSSLTAPNPNAQAEVIASAMRRASIDVNTVNYIETHGTGTSLGDPIEIAGLHKAFEILSNEQGKDKLTVSFCGLGAVKTNIGHLEAAAGMAGVIKVILAMQHHLIPGNIHFKQPKPLYKTSRITLLSLIKHNHGNIFIMKRAYIARRADVKFIWVWWNECAYSY